MGRLAFSTKESAQDMNNRHQIETRIKEMLAEGGVWDRVLDAEEKLEPLINQCLANTQATPPYPGMSANQTHDFLLGHAGLHGELYNGPQKSFQLYQQGIGNLSDMLVKWRDERSQYAGLSAKLFPGLKLPGMDEAGQVQEKKPAALVRCAEEIEKWVALNAAHIPKHEFAAIHEALGEYRTNLAEVSTCMEEAAQALAAAEKTRGGR